MELPVMRSFKLALGVNTAGDPSASVPTNSGSRRGGGSSVHSSVSGASSVAGSPFGRRDTEDGEDDEGLLLSHRSNASAGSRSRSRGRSSTATSAERDALLNLPLDKEFVPLAHHEDEDDEEEEGGEETDVVRDDVRDDVICMIFDLPHTTKFYQDFSCAIAATLAMHGRMYPTDSHVCFYSNVFGRERKILIPYESISEIAKTTTMVFQNAIRIATNSKDEYTFTSFWGNNRDGCYDLIAKTRSRVLNELKPAVVRGLQRTSIVLGEGIDGDARSASSPATSPVSTASAKSGVASAALTAQQQQHEETDDADSDAENTQTHETSFARPDTIQEDRDNASQQQQQQQHQQQDDNTDDLHAPVRRASVVSDIGSVAPKDISMTQIVEEMFDVSADEFMSEFFWDDAKFGLDTFGASQGYTEMKCNPWMTPLEDDESSFGMTRSLQFRVPVDAPIGPKSSRVDVLQCVKTGEQNVRVVETSTRLVDIPYGDYFSVEDRWTLVPSGSNQKSCKLFIELKVVFSKSTFWKSKIETRAIADNKTKWLLWVETAKKHLANKDARQSATATPPTSTPKSERGTRHQHSAGENSSTNNEGRARRDSAQLSSRTAPKRRSSRASSSLRTKQQVMGQAVGSSPPPPSNSFILYLRVFPWILVLGLLFLVIRMQASLANIEQTVLLTNAKMAAIERQLESLASLAGGPTST
ncbi:hypothetical protein Gpo141_00005806 [Globisporangium polare]